MNALPEKRREPAGGTASSPKPDWLASKSHADDSDMRAAAQRLLVMKLAAGAGLSVALASCIVVLALGDGGRP